MRLLTILFFLASNLLAGTALIRSADGGRTWIDIDPGPPHQGVLSLQIAPDGSRLYALTVTRTEPPPLDSFRDFSVLSSSDGGRTWLALEPLGVTRGFAAMAVAPSDPGTVYLARGTLDYLQPFSDMEWLMRLLRTTDAGRTAAEVPGIAEALGPYKKYPYFCSPVPEFFAVHPAISTNVFVSLDCAGDSVDPFNVFLRTPDGGRTWRRSDVGVTQLLAEPREPSTLYSRYLEPYTRRPHLAKSTDGGNAWSLRLADVATLALNPRDPAVLLASKNDGSLWKSTDRAETWEHLVNLLPFDRMMIHPARPSLVLAQAPALLHQGLNTGEIFKSQDGGATWSVLPTGMDGFWFVFDPKDPDTIYGLAEKRLEPRLRPPYIRNLAGGSTLAPGALFSIYGEDLAGDVTFNGRPADLLFVSGRQINGRVPVDLPPGEVLVEMPGQPPQSITLGRFATPVILYDSSGDPHVYHLESGRKVTAADPIVPGERFVVYCAGLGEPETRYVQFWPLERPSAVQPVLFAEAVADQPAVYRVGIEAPRSLVAGSYLMVFWGGRNFARLEVR